MPCCRSILWAKKVLTSSLLHLTCACIALRGLCLHLVAKRGRTTYWSHVLIPATTFMTSIGQLTAFTITSQSREKSSPRAHRELPSRARFPPVRQNLRAGIHIPVCQQRVIGQSSSLPFFFDFNFLFTYLHRYSIGNGLLVQAPSDCTKSSTSLPDA